MIAVSACLAGKPCRYDGRANHSDEAAALFEAGNALLICPECMGGLPTPREPAEISGGGGADVLDGRARVMTQSGGDVTEAFLSGAHAALALCRAHGVSEALLKAKSPSCGCGAIYDGTFSRRLTAGDGVSAALLRRSGIAVRTELGEREPGEENEAWRTIRSL